MRQMLTFRRVLPRSCRISFDDDVEYTVTSDNKAGRRPDSSPLLTVADRLAHPESQAPVRPIDQLPSLFREGSGDG